MIHPFLFDEYNFIVILNSFYYFYTHQIFFFVDLELQQLYLESV